MKITKTLDVKTRREWRKWLQEHYGSESEIWLVMHKKGYGASLLYNDAVEEALCFGWIDSIVKSIDETKFVQRYSPRKTKKGYSQPNIERLRKLVRQGKVIKKVRDSLPEGIFRDKPVSADILKALKKDKEVWANFQCFSDSYKRIRIAYIEGARSRPDEFKKRLLNFVKKTKENIEIGFGGVDTLY